MDIIKKQEIEVIMFFFELKQVLDSFIVVKIGYKFIRINLSDS